MLPAFAPPLPGFACCCDSPAAQAGITPVAVPSQPTRITNFPSPGAANPARRLPLGRQLRSTELLWARDGLTSGLAGGRRSGLRRHRRHGAVGLARSAFTSSSSSGWRRSTTVVFTPCGWTILSASVKRAAVYLSAYWVRSRSSTNKAKECRLEGRHVTKSRGIGYSGSGHEPRFADRDFLGLRSTAGPGPSRRNQRLGVSFVLRWSFAMSSGDGFPVHTMKPPIFVWESRRAM